MKKITSSLIALAVLILIAGVGFYVYQGKLNSSALRTDESLTSSSHQEASSNAQTTDSSVSTLVDTTVCVLSDCTKYPSGKSSFVITKDSQHIYAQGKILQQADPSSFTILKTSTGEMSVFARDNTHYFDLINRTVIGAVESTTLVVDTDTTAKVNGKSYSVAF
ncbi:MAG: hypothetical protein JWO84_368 [Parcubacteria group bacterium]|nr:hypothetical protein [Parcubacteria group bacterium]